MTRLAVAPLLLLGLALGCSEPASVSTTASASASVSASTASFETAPTQDNAIAEPPFVPGGPFTAAAEKIDAVALARNGRTAAVVSGPNLMVFDAATGTRLCTVYADDLDRLPTLSAVAVSDDGSIVAARQYVSGVHVVSVAGCQAVFRGKVMNGTEHGSLAFSSDGRKLFAYTDGTRPFHLVSVVDLAAGTEQTPLASPNIEGTLAPTGDTAVLLAPASPRLSDASVLKSFTMSRASLGEPDAAGARGYTDVAPFGQTFTERPFLLAFERGAESTLVATGNKLELVDLGTTSVLATIEATTPPLAAGIAADAIAILYADHLELRTRAGELKWSVNLPQAITPSPPLSPNAFTVVKPRADFVSNDGSVFATYALNGESSADSIRGTVVHLLCRPSPAGAPACEQRRADLLAPVPFPNFAWQNTAGGFSDDGRTYALSDGAMVRYGAAPEPTQLAAQRTRP